VNALYSAALWTIGGLHFAAGAAALALLWLFVEPRRTQGLQRAFCRSIVRLAGARLEVRGAPGCDARRAGFIVCNHVNLFDAFVLGAALPQFARGLELESHFNIPVYGWLMRRAGNVPVPDVKTRADLRRMWKLAQEALSRGISLVVFPEGARTRDGRLRPFHEGVFRMAQRFGAPLTPVTISGAFAWNNKMSRRLHPARVVVTLHPAIETAGLGPADVPALRDRTRAAIASALAAEGRSSS
jgi:1-acyl-sn-glycerol-3-phosphate acyltransferase